jgi:hypothetical protein
MGVLVNGNRWLWAAAGIVITVLACAASGARIAPASASTRTHGSVAANPYAGRVGVVISHDLFNDSTSEIEAQFAQIRAGGVSWAREDFEWGVIEPQRGVFNWAPFDRLMQAASSSGVQVLGILDYSAPWASSDPTGNENKFYPPTNNSDFASYAAAVAARYGAGGSFWAANPALVPDPLTTVEIWNEPFGSWYWKPGPNPEAYAALVNVTAPAIHAADPQMQVLISGDLQSWDDRNAATGTQAQPWLAQLLAVDPGIGKLVNGLDVHPYPEPRNTGPYATGASAQQAFGRIALIRATEVAAGVNLPIWITEIGWSTDPSTPFSVSAQTQATFLRDAVQRSINGWGSYVAKIFLFGWYRSNNVPGDPGQNFGLIKASGAVTPAWTAITRLLGGVPGGSDPDASLAN